MTILHESLIITFHFDACKRLITNLQSYIIDSKKVGIKFVTHSDGFRASFLYVAIAVKLAMEVHPFDRSGIEKSMTQKRHEHRLVKLGVNIDTHSLQRL